MEPETATAYVNAVYSDSKDSIRVRYLRKGISLTAGDRDREYGPPFNNLSDCATLFTAYLKAKYGSHVIGSVCFDLTAEDIAWLNVLQKIARTFSGNPKPDTYIDAATYEAIAGECAQIQNED